MAGHGAPGRAPRAASFRREGKQRPVRSAKLTRIASPSADAASVAVQVEGDRDKGKHGASGVRSTRPEAADFGHTLPVHTKGAC